MVLVAVRALIFKAPEDDDLLTPRRMLSNPEYVSTELAERFNILCKFTEKVLSLKTFGRILIGFCQDSCLVMLIITSSRANPAGGE